MRSHRFALNPVIWSIIIFIVAQILTFVVVSRENGFLAQNNIYVPTQPPQAVSIWPSPQTTLPSGTISQTPVYSSLGPILIYFFSVVIVLGIVLFFVPVSTLKLLLKGLFAFLFGWGIFIILAMWLPLAAAICIALLVGVGWFFFPRVWLHNIGLMLALVAVGAVFGRFISPWTAMILLGVLAIYDFMAVHFGYMLWMARKMSDTNALPAFIIPRGIREWNVSLKQYGVSGIADQQPAERKYSILGGGDIGFPLLLISSVYFAYGFGHAVIIALFTLAGLGGAYWAQKVIFKGKATPALPPIAVISVIGLVIVSFVI